MPFYLKQRVEPNWLVISIDAAGLTQLRELHDEDPEGFDSNNVMTDVFDHLLGSSELQWGTASETGDLTDGPMLIILGEERLLTEDQAKDCSGYSVTSRHYNERFGCPIVSRWVFMDYAVTSPQRRLLEKGVVLFQGGAFMKDSLA